MSLFLLQRIRCAAAAATLATAALLGGACDDEPTGGGGSAGEDDPEQPALDVRLVVDPNQTTEADLAGRLTSIVVIVDAEEGLYAPGEETQEGLVQVKNADADPSDLEIVATLTVEGDRLPTFRLERGGLEDVPIDLRVLGFTEGGASHVVEGALRAARFGDAPVDVALPFLLRASDLPPRVVDVLPADGASISGCALPSVTIVFSRPVDADSLALEGAIELSSHGPPSSITLDASGLVATLGIDGFEGVGESLAFHLVATEAIRAADGGPGLDQAPAEVGAQSFVIDVTLTCTPPPVGPCTPPRVGPDCAPSCGGTICTPDPRVECVDQVCVLASCSEACPEATVCAPEAAACLPDCRLVGAVDGCAPPSACDMASGLCRGGA